MERHECSAKPSFRFVASTGRTATTFIAAYLRQFPCVSACHEGHVRNDETDAFLPLINIENAAVYKEPSRAHSVVAAKRNDEILRQAAEAAGTSTIVDVAYYNSVLASALLKYNQEWKGVGIVRDCEEFVRSSTCISGEDVLPVGWPASDKPLSPRERFIQMGRIRPRPETAESAEWASWSAIRKNIWLWRETNALLVRARDKFPARFKLKSFADFQSDNDAFLESICRFFDITLNNALRAAEISSAAINKKRSGYQVGPSSQWSAAEQAHLAAAQEDIWSKFDG